ncbi:MAG: M15 family metallopeptidase [Myxococcota bacterium]
MYGILIIMLATAPSQGPASVPASPKPSRSGAQDEVSKDRDELVDATAIEPRWKLDVRYATSDNFTGQVLYPVARCVLRREVAEMLKKAQSYLDREHPGYVFRLKDCYRPRSVQVRMWKVVKGTPSQGYVANPYGTTGSVHNYGAAVDLTLNGPEGEEVDMGTPYDSFQRLAQPRYEDEYLRAGKLSKQQVAHRRILRSAMRHAGFRPIRNEWWHFDAFQGRALRARYSIMDIPLDAPQFNATPRASEEMKRSE